MPRIKRLAKAVTRYATPLRVLLIAGFAAGLVIVMSEDSVWRVSGVALSTLTLFVLLAQQNWRTDAITAMPQVIAAPEPTPEPSVEPMLPIPTGGAPRVAVIIPGRNEAAYVGDCILSLKAQTLTQFEAIIIDDASTDSTLDALAEAIGDDPRFRVVSLESSVGPGRARNLGVSLAEADTVTFLDLDDFLAPAALASRLEKLLEHADKPWVAGAYSWHEGLPASSSFSSWDVPTWRARHRTISWLQRPDDNVFVVSAPLLWKDAFEAVGGFEDAIGEDPKLWFTMLRAGFTFVGTGKVEIGYRQKPNSRFQVTYREMADDVADLIRRGEEPTDRPEGVTGPYWYGESMADLRYAHARANRLAATLGFAVAYGDDDVIHDILQRLEELPVPLRGEGWEMSIEGHAKNGATRIAKAMNTNPHVPFAVDSPFAAWESKVSTLIEPLSRAAVSEARRWRDEPKPAPSVHHAAPPVHRRLELRKRLTVTEETLPKFLGGERPFLILPSAAYHTDELVDLVPELRRRGFTPFAMINDTRWETTGSAMARVDVPIVDALEPGPWLERLSGLLTFNDWGEYYAAYVRHLSNMPVPTFAKVEGVQDWNDVDTGRSRNAYLSADVVMCQGDNDVAALTGRRGNLEIVGSDRLERIWNDPLPRDGDPSVVANVNFTYGVLTEHRDLWVSTTIEAADRVDLPLTLSMHPSETARYPDRAATDPLRHLLTVDSIFVSRFSTAIYEGMARGCVCIYYNPHGERVETFQNPEGAFFTAGTMAELEDALRTARTIGRDEAKERAAAFFARQVSMVPGRSVAERAAAVIDAYTHRS